MKMDVNELLKNLDRLHTTELGNERIRRNCQIQDQDVVAWAGLISSRCRPRSHAKGRTGMRQLQAV